MPALSAHRPIMPPRASISRTICPLASPPMAGLHERCPMRSTLPVISSTRCPNRANVMAASQPACPAPTTIQSNISFSLGKSGGGKPFWRRVLPPPYPHPSQDFRLVGRGRKRSILWRRGRESPSYTEISPFNKPPGDKHGSSASQAARPFIGQYKSLGWERGGIWGGEALLQKGSPSPIFIIP